jgi:hypothetical protein
LQEQALNHLKLLWSRATVVSVKEKSRHRIVAGEDQGAECKRTTDAYRSGKSAIEAIGVARKRCWRYDWVVDLDIKRFFDNLDHELMMRAVRKDTDCRRLLLYIELRGG